MRRFRLHLLGFPCLLAIIQSCASGAAVERLPKQVIGADICTLIREPQVYDGRMVRTDANARAGLHYEIFLYGELCSQSIVVLSIPRRLEDDESVARLLKHIFTGFPWETAPAQVTLTGRFHWHQGEVPARVLVLTEVIAVDPLHKSG